MAAPAKAPAAVAVKTMVGVFGCVGVFAFAYAYAVDRYSSCFEAHNRWLMALNVDFYINVAVIAAWVIYKESSWVIAAIVVVLLIVFGSDVIGHTRGSSVATTRVVFSVVGCLMLGTFVYLLIVDGSPFHAKVFTPCMIGTLIDFYANIAFLLVWIAYKKSSWLSAFFWILLLVCFGGVISCAYVVRLTFDLSPQQPLSLIIFNRRNKDLLSSEPLLTAHGNV